MSHTPDFHKEMDRLQGHIPGWAGRNFDRLRRPRAIWVRVPAGIAITGGGVLGFLCRCSASGCYRSALRSLPTTRRPLARVLHFTNYKIEQRKERSAGEKAG
jgi:hypothetical protein